MAKMITYRVEQGRIRFKCSNCGARRLHAAPPMLRERTITCHQCGEKNRCRFNRRLAAREQQTGTISAELGDGKMMDVKLADISLYGVGFDVTFRNSKQIHVGQELRLRCEWNKRLLSNQPYKVRSIKGQRVGAELKKAKFL